jgi:SAM-dependent methyltransferase
MTQRPHSAEHFTKSRDLWWHADYLQLLAHRLETHRCHSILDLGAGVGHWTALVAQLCAPDAAITAVDREPAWVAELARRFAGRKDFAAVQADVADLSAIAGPFDLVTCQTLLLHVTDVPGVLAQMRRLLAPGVTLLLAEPNNFLNRMGMTSVTAELTPVEFGALATFWWAFEKGREQLGLGREWIAEVLPKLIVDAGFENLMVFQNDRTSARFPPYATIAQTTSLAEQADRSKTDAEAAEREQTRRCVLAGGLDAAAFDRTWILIQDIERRTERAVAERTFSCAGSDHFFVLAAKVPA